MRRKADLRKLGQLGVKYAELFRLVQQGTRPAEPVLDALQHLVEGRKLQTIFDHTVPPLFVEQHEQVANVRRWNEQYELGFTDDDFDHLETPPDWPNRHHEFGPVAAVLVPSLGTPEHTGDVLWTIAAEQQSVAYRRTGLGTLCLRPELGAQFKPQSLEWAIVRLDGGWDSHGYDLPWGEPHLAHADVLAALAHFPDWVRVIGTVARPDHLFLTGYLVAGHNDIGPASPVVQWATYGPDHGRGLCLK